MSPSPSFAEEVVLSRDQTLCFLLVWPDRFGMMGDSHLQADDCHVLYEKNDGRI